jgi:branched-chain amino acid transport system ATP-binding protein
MPPMLEITDLTAGYGRVPVLRNVALRVTDGQIVGLLGPNGAGKTTLARAISGLIACRAGSIRFDRRNLHQMRAQDIVRLGVLHVPQGRMLFHEMSVAENLEMGAYTRRGREERDRALSEVYEFFPILGERRRQPAGLLSGGEQQMLAIGRAMMLQPRLLILDEPSTGLAPRTMGEIFSAVERINRDGTAILLIEQNARRTLAIAEHCYVLETGRVAAEGSARSLTENEVVRHVYLGLR